MAKLFNLVCDGNSLTVGQSATPNPDVAGWPNVFRTTQNIANRYWSAKVTAVSGRATPTNTSEIQNTIAPLFHRGFGMNVVTFFEGVNDVVSNAANLATCQNNWIAYVAAARAVGYKVLCMTPLPTTNTANNANTIMPQLAQWVRDTPSISDFPIVDIAGHASLSDPTNLTFYQADGLHLTNAGYSVIAGLVLERIAALT